MAINLELGTGNKPTPGFIHADKFKHSPHIDLAFDLEVLPWPVESNTVFQIRAIDTFEHIRPWKVEVSEWLAECWRILVPGGMLIFRVPAWDHHYSYRDITHYRVFHPESFHYFCPDAPGTVFRDFGQYYFGKDYHSWWNWREVEREASDLKFKLSKPIPQ